VRAFVALGLNDLRNITRDSLLLFMLAMPWLLVILARTLVPWLTVWLSDKYNFDLTLYYPLLVSFFFVLQMPVLFGLIIGFVILDERDDGVLAALQVTPVSLPGYLSYRISGAVFLTFIHVLLTTPLTGLSPALSFLDLTPAALLSSLFATILALLLAIFAGNKVEGLALMKALGGILIIGPLGAYFVSPNWELLFGILPSYWPVKVFWSTNKGHSMLPYLLGGIVYLSSLLFLLLRLFRKRTDH